MQQFNPQFNQMPYRQQFNPVPQMYNSQQNTLKIITVTNKEEANATPVEFNGLPTFFYNQSTNEIYKKQFDINSGIASLQEFKKIELVGSSGTNENTSSGINTLENNLSMINERLNAIEKILKEDIEIEETKGGKNAK